MHPLDYLFAWAMCVSPVLELQECFGQGPFGQNISADGI